MCYQQLIEEARSVGSRRSPSALESNSDAAALRRDFAADYVLWNRCVLEDFIQQRVSPSAKRRRQLKRWSSGQSLLPDAVVRELFHLAPHRPVPTEPNGHVPFAEVQRLAMAPLARCEKLTDVVQLRTFPQLHQIFQQEWESMSALRTLSHYVSEELVLTQELITHIAAYLKGAYEEVMAKEGKGSSSAAPIVCCFDKTGRLASELNRSGLLPVDVVSVCLPIQAVQRDRSLRVAQRECSPATSIIPQCHALGEFIHPQCFSTATVPPVDVCSVGDALRKYKPALCVIVPHRGGRDFFCDIRGFHSVRRVLALGPLDSPAMGSAWFPFLSFGVTPGPTSYLVFNDRLQAISSASKIQMPTDPPHVAQGYTKRYLPSLSSWLIAPNDTLTVGYAYGALEFVRVAPPIPAASATDSAAPPSPPPPSPAE